ncbi:hypothetical protein [Halogeometricum limi]|uniref:Uncharacterized protein n=1 Tax=Halogeometricum limi TaxID=555875 RepID=A0A1I6FX96_9EURY|nr:hypothetical protein [Halogeometricum limi]SFR34582.1 hypothetical protein SAMN04488124_0482 [Halogeometricum limi]
MKDTSSNVPFWWVLLFIVLALGAGAAIVFAVGGSLISAGAGALLPLPGLH